MSGSFFMDKRMQKTSAMSGLEGMADDYFYAKENPHKLTRSDQFVGKFLFY